MSRRYMSIEEFRQLGFLQEANRLFFHPRGLALEVVVDDDGVMRLGGIWDSRGDAEGIVFADDHDPDMAKTVEDERLRHDEMRRRLFGGNPIQGEGIPR